MVWIGSTTTIGLNLSRKNADNSVNGRTRHVMLNGPQFGESYGKTKVHDLFWTLWFAQNRFSPLITQNMVFPLSDQQVAEHDQRQQYSRQFNQLSVDQMQRILNGG